MLRDSASQHILDLRIDNIGDLVGDEVIHEETHHPGNDRKRHQEKAAPEESPRPSFTAWRAHTFTSTQEKGSGWEYQFNLERLRASND